MAGKQSHLNGAYYGPSIPPPSKTFHRPGHGGGGGCGFCGCLGCLFNCCCSCILNLICQILLTLIIIAAIVVFLLWLIFRPNVLKFHATDASLTQFNLTANNVLHYDLALNITARNPNRRIGIYYDQIEANAFYAGQRLSMVNLTRFYQGHKNTSLLSPLFVGQKAVLLGTDVVSAFDSEKSSGIFSVDVKLDLRVRFKVGWVKFGHYKPKINCALKVPLKSSSGVFETTRCSYDL